MLSNFSPGILIVGFTAQWQAQGKVMHDYVSTHQDRSKNALLKSIEAAFLAWAEDVKTDQAQFLSEKILNLGGIGCIYACITL